MMMHCFVCGFNTQPGITLHQFPTKETVRLQWLQACGLGFVEYWKNLKLCSNHFSPDDYNKNSKRRCLVRNTVPSRFLVRKTEPEDIKPPGQCHTLKNTSNVNTVQEAGSSSKNNSQLRCPLSMCFFEGCIGEYPTRWVCKLCLTTIFSMNSVLKHLEHCHIPPGYTLDSEDDEENVPFKPLRRLQPVFKTDCSG